MTTSWRMNTMIKKTYHISGFDCPNCAHKSEQHLAKQDGIDYCHIDFSTNKMFITYKDKELSVEEIADVIAQVESDPLDIHDLDKKVVKKTYHISGFDCPNCAHKSEQHLAKQEGVESCHIDFSTNKLFITYKSKPFTVEQIAKIIAQVESDPLDIHELESKKEHKERLFTPSMWFLLARVIFGVLAVILCLTVFNQFDDTGWIRFAIYSVATVLLTYDVFWRVVLHIKNLRNIIDHNLLISIALIGATVLSIIHLTEGDVHHGVHFAM